MTRREFARLIGCSEATASRLASGKRKPSLPMMERIEQILKWKVALQVAALRDGQYAEEFNKALAKRASSTQKGKTSGATNRD